MLHITIIAVGKLKERYWTEACNEYLKRLSAYADVRVKEIADLDPAKCGGEKAAVKAESESIISAIPKSCYAVLLDISSKQITSEGLSQFLDDQSLSGINDICFIIGGSCGVDDKVRQACDKKISLGKITLPHNLCRVVLLEQLFRAFKISKGEPYHK